MLPFTFVAGVDGFAIFVPYLVLVVLVAMIVRWRKNQPIPVVVRAEIPPSMRDLAQPAM
jgi:hypothetical protein